MYRRPRPDVIVGSSPPLFAAYAAQKLAQRLRVPFVLEVRDLWPQTMIEVGRYTESHPLIKSLSALERYLYRRADHIVTLLPLAGEHMVSHGAHPGRITWIPNGVALLPLTNQPEWEGSRNFVALYAGAHGPLNALDGVLDAAATEALRTTQPEAGAFHRREYVDAIG